MDSRLIFLPHGQMRWEDGGYKVKHIIGFVLLVLDQRERKIRLHTVGTDGSLVAILSNLIEEPSKKNL